MRVPKRPTGSVTLCPCNLNGSADTASLLS